MKCKACGAPTNPIGTSKTKYHIFCSCKCAGNYSETKNKHKQTCLERYGVENPMHYKQFSDKCPSPFLNKENQLKAQNTIFHKYGVKCPLQNTKIYRKLQQTNLQIYGYENCFQNAQVLAKKKQTMINRYGVENPMQNSLSLQKQQKTSYHALPYTLPSGRIIHKQGYEPQFLDYVFQNNILKEEEIMYSPKCIKYKGIDNKEHYYHPDFYIPKWNLIIEIKSNWTIKWDKNILAKETAVLQQGLNYFRIIDNNFILFSKKYHS